MSSAKDRKPIFLAPGAGRPYPMGRISSTFKADGEETGNSFSISEWWLEPNTKGPPPHQHEDDHAFYILEGTMTVSAGGASADLSKGGFVVIPGGTPHTFENRNLRERAGMLSFNNRGGFEEAMPGISAWFIENPPGNAVEP